MQGGGFSTGFIAGTPDFHRFFDCGQPTSLLDLCRLKWGHKAIHFELLWGDFQMLFDYSNVLVFAVVGIGFVLTALLIGSFVRPQVPTLEKLSTYECGEHAIGSAWVNFNIRFYVVALVFVVFDVEIAFMFPIALVFREFVEKGEGLLVFLKVFAFIFILLLGFIYSWAKGDLDWVKRLTQEVKKTA